MSGERQRQRGDTLSTTPVAPALLMALRMSRGVTVRGTLVRSICPDFLNKDMSHAAVTCPLAESTRETKKSAAVESERESAVPAATATSRGAGGQVAHAVPETVEPQTAETTAETPSPTTTGRQPGRARSGSSHQHRPTTQKRARRPRPSARMPRR